MTMLTVDVPTNVYEALHQIARLQGKTIEGVATEWLAKQSVQAHANVSPPPPLGERERVITLLRTAGLLAEPSPEVQARAARSKLTLDEARTILDRAGGTSLSEIILEMRGPKE